ncbi:MAG: chemotaxis protein CheX [Myxococcota bacterium]
MKPAVDEIREILAVARDELLEGYAVSQEVSRKEALDSVSAIIGFTSANIRGNLLVSSPHDFLKRWVEQMTEGPAVDDQLHDWVGELSNQLLGRFKRKLLSRGVEIEMTPPSIVVGSNVRLRSPSRARRVEVELTRPGFDCALDLEVDDGFEIPEADSAAMPIGEGDLMLL